MKLSEAGLTSNIDYWKRVAERYKRQRDMATEEIRWLQRLLYEQTGKAYDGNDYLRQILATKHKPSLLQRIKNFIKR